MIKYTDQRLAFGSMRLEDERMPALIAEGRKSHDRIFALVERSVAENNRPSIYNSVVGGFNGLVMADDKRLYGTLNHAPGSIILMLVVLGMYTTFSMGRLRDPKEKWRSSLMRVAPYMVLVAFVFCVIVDLEQPRRGLLRVSQLPMTQLRQSL